jgi:hypothetical protein
LEHKRNPLKKPYNKPSKKLLKLKKNGNPNNILKKVQIKTLGKNNFYKWNSHLYKNKDK